MDRCMDVIASPTFRVALLLFLDGLAIMGIIKSIGIYVVEIMQELGANSTDIGVALGLLFALVNIPAPLAAYVFRKETLRRPLLLCASVMLPFGLVLTSLVRHKYLLPVCLSISGIGGCLLQICGTIVLKDQSGSHFNLVLAISLTGFGVGMAVFPLIAEFLRRAYGWRGGLLILGGLMANLIPCAASVKVAGQSESVRRENQEDHRGSNDGNISGNPSRDVANEMKEKDDGISALLFSDPQRDTHIDTKTIVSAESAVSGTPQNDDYDGDTERMSQEEIDPLIKDRKTNSLTNADAQDNSEDSRTYYAFLCNLIPNCLKIDFCLDPLLTAIFVAVLFIGYFTSGWHNFVVPRAIQRQLSTQSILVITGCASIGSITGRLSVGYLCNNRFEPVNVFVIFTLANIGSLLCDVFFVNPYVMMVTTFFSAYLIGGRILLAPMAVIERAPVGKKDMAVAFYYFFLGIGKIIGGYLSGKVADAFLSYDVTFLLIIGVEVIIFFILLVAMAINKLSSNRSQ